MDADELRLRFTYHEPTADQPARYIAVRREAMILAELINEAVQDSREKSLAITHLEEVVFWANAGIAREQR